MRRLRKCLVVLPQGGEEQKKLIFCAMGHVAAEQVLTRAANLLERSDEGSLLVIPCGHAMHRPQLLAGVLEGSRREGESGGEVRYPRMRADEGKDEKDAFLSPPPFRSLPPLSGM
uniref:Uncharacterized protein n=1 Tax=Chromera velia CCMP2878 TaxID=1169474 RepID=A0A0G4GCD7_9ALVE|eukprot:Cvel_4485.t1-p1 / transcript=Cvel_4485.t1 / gene=Cvel_4485 / organism=Chromera_velia_CCMP2878 / gene_product=hypothetical protein / transcript_product=hypothetical protein / location=Cvel_scaffold196:49388-57346(+) / protein_length=114 / sequence_SO=supercontig / SO=protein_coding / is_pseudo=false